MHHARKRNSDEPISSGSDKRESTFDTKKIATFCDHLLDAYIEKSPEEKNAVVKMKELWWYLGKNFKNSEEYLTQIRKSQTIREYRWRLNVY